ncbi:hypothetical protein [Dongia mobilis]|uniref:hypothetical protein n=1 Tax=Dongia sp. TaxID=1977262 RepID=UPI0026E95C89
MTDFGHTIIGPDGSVLGAGDKVPCELAMQRASNESRRVYEAWHKLRMNGNLPGLTDWENAKAVPDLQHSVLVTEILAEPHDYRYLKLGSRAIEVRGYDPTGKTVRDCYEGDALVFVLDNYDQAIAYPYGIVDFSIEVVRDHDFIELETLLLPLADDGSTPSHVLVYGHFLLR